MTKDGVAFFLFFFPLFFVVVVVVFVVVVAVVVVVVVVAVVVVVNLKIFMFIAEKRRKIRSNLIFVHFRKRQKAFISYLTIYCVTIEASKKTWCPY